MVGVEDVQKVTPRQMRWLRRGGRDMLHELFSELEAKLQGLGLIGDFSGTIWLPSDIIVDAKKKGELGGVFWTFGEDKRKEALELARRLRECDPDVSVRVTTARKYLDIKGNLIKTDFNWHGHEGASIAFSIIDQVFNAVEAGGDVVRLEAIVDVGLEKPVKLPFFAPDLPEEKMLAFAEKWCKPGTYLILKDKRILKRTERGMKEARPEDVAKLALCEI